MPHLYIPAQGFLRRCSCERTKSSGTLEEIFLHTKKKHPREKINFHTLQNTTKGIPKYLLLHVTTWLHEDMYIYYESGYVGVLET